MPRHVERSHAKRVGLHLKRPLTAEEGFPRQRIDLADLFIGHGVTADRGAVAVDHQGRTGPAVGPIIGVGETGIDGEMVGGVRVHQIGRDGVEALGRLPVAFLEFRAQAARPAANRVGAQQREASALVGFP